MSFETIIILNLILYIVALFLTLGLNNSVLGEASGWISVFTNVMGFILATSLMLNYSDAFLIVYPWIKAGNIVIDFEFLINSQTVFMLALVQFVSLFVQIFSMKYLMNDAGLPRYFAIINLFLFAILGLVLSGNLFQMYIFWEVVGFSSYLLIGYWYEKPEANEASIKAFLMNRFGDIFMLLGILIIFVSCDTVGINELNHLKSFKLINGLPLDAYQIQTVSILLIFVGVVAKSAQFPLSTWLPDAMEGPTPASALIHAATMVVVGVFLLARISNLINAEAGLYIAIIGSVTSVLGGFSALFQYDIKKVLAYSTISQIGLMITGIGIGAVAPTLFHLTTHAFFKAGLFLCAGAVIDYCNHQQDMRLMGDLKSKMPVVFLSYILCAAAIIGIPLTSGYLSKESLLSAIYSYGLPQNGVMNIKIIIPILITLSVFLTAFYMVRQAVFVFFERKESPFEKMIEGIRNAVLGFISGITNVVTANDDNKGEDPWLIRFFRSLTAYELSTLFLAAGTGWLFYTANPMDVESNWFVDNFKNIPLIHFQYQALIVLSISLLAIIIGFNVARFEIRNLETKENEEMGAFQHWAANHYYLDKLISISAETLIIGKPVLMNVETLFNANIQNRKIGGLSSVINYVEEHLINDFVSYLSKSFVFLSNYIRWFEVKVIDATVNFIIRNIKYAGGKLRLLQNGNVQKYIMSLFVFLITIIILKLLF